MIEAIFVIVICFGFYFVGFYYGYNLSYKEVYMKASKQFCKDVEQYITLMELKGEWNNEEKSNAKETV